MSYLLDTNVFIQAKNLHYGLDFCPAFWDWIDEAHDKGDVFSIEKVSDELAAGGDDLAAWAQEHTDSFFLKPDAAVVPSFQVTSTWASGAGYDPAAVSTFLQVADYYLVAHAHAHGPRRRDPRGASSLFETNQDTQCLHRSGGAGSLAPSRRTPSDLGSCGGRDRRRSGDLALFRRALCQLSYPTVRTRVLLVCP